ncbi:tRNA (guanosine(46)-N7)-methyltransferase TrmB [Hymenobacter humi]|uniref:tRNA (guanine(46)-N(7))-methyltransferase n=1 Tax=Hymenobacter humi TaxID=1411620 RepID=A0ABW2U7K5_9BACT
MPRVKLQRFTDNATRPDIIEPGKPGYEQARRPLAHRFFPEPHPLTLEVGCGKGEYTVGLAQRHPSRNFLGLDIKGERIWRGSTRAAEMGLTNVGFVRMRAEALAAQFGPGELNEIWITFPDPRPRDRDIKRRLTSPRFLALYEQLLTAGGCCTSRPIMPACLTTRSKPWPAGPVLWSSGLRATFTRRVARSLPRPRPSKPTSKASTGRWACRLSTCSFG